MQETSRRTFLAAGAAVAAPFFIRAADKAGTKLPVIGEGKHHYEWIQNWGKLPSNIKYGNCHALAEDSQGNIYVLHTVNKDSQKDDSIVVFDDRGKFVKSWGWQFKRGRMDCTSARKAAPNTSISVTHSTASSPKEL